MQTQRSHAEGSRGLAAASALVVGLLVGFVLTGFAGGPVPPAAEAPTAASGEVPPTVVSAEVDRRADVAAEHDTILEVIRDHRRLSSESWRRRLADAIYQESREASVDPLLVTSIVARESSFRPRVVSHKGAVGLMQLRPFVARDLAERHALDWNGLDTLHDPTLNVRLGVSYYKELVERFEGDHAKALTAYNYGPTRVSRQLREGTYSGSGYARQILALYDRLAAATAPDA